MKTTYLFNPFKYIAGWKALALGWAIMLITACIAWYGKTHFNGVIDAHYGLAAPFRIYVFDAAIAWALAVACFYAAALIFSGSSVRLIDMAGTMALARAPMIFVALLFLAMPPANHLLRAKNSYDIGAGPLLLSVAAVVFIVWLVALMYRAFTVSANLKGSRAAWIFFVTLAIAEVLSQFIFFPLYRHLIQP
jgi:hypothetical protein